MDSNSCSGQLVGSGSLDCSLWLSLSKVGHFRTSHVSWVLCKLSDVEEGRSEVEDDHGSPAEKLGTKVLNSLDWTVQAFVDARISTEALLQPDAVESILQVLDAKAGWVQEDESKLLLRKALFSVERGKDESLRQYTTRRLA